MQRDNCFYKNYKTTNARDGGAAMTYGNSIMAALYWPWTTKTTNPKWPDGAANYSLGKRDVQTTVVTGQEILVALFPGQHNYMLVFDASASLDDCTLANFRIAQNFEYEVEEEDGGIAKLLPADDSIAAGWRPVAYAATIKCISADEDNTGTFEAVRTTRQAYYDKFGVIVDKVSESLAPEAYSMGFRPGHSHPNKELIDEWRKQRNWTMAPSFGFGNTLAMDELVFQLNPERQKNDILSIHDRQFDFEDGKNREKTIANEVQLIWGLSNSTDELSASRIKGHEETTFHNTFVAQSFDTILVRLHGAQEDTKWLITGVSCTEWTMPENSPLKSYLSPSYAMTQALERYIYNRTKDAKSPFGPIKAQQYQYENDDYN